MTETAGRARGAVSVGIDRIGCDGRGLCAAVLPERISLDEWGFPVVDATPVERAAAREAARICPVRALYLREPATAGTVKTDSSGR